VVLAVSRVVEQRTGTDPLLSRATFDYGVDVPAWELDELGRQIEKVEAALDSLPARRRPFFQHVLAALAMMVREAKGEAIPYAERVETYLQVPCEPISEEVVDSLADELRALLQEAGYPEELAAGIPQWRADRLVTGDTLAEQAHRFLQRARERTEERVLPLPPGHEVELSFPPSSFSRGYSDYSRDYRGRVFLNGAIDWELPAVKHVICHEVFPGHQAISGIREWRYRQGQLDVEGTVYMANTPFTPIVEGMCEIGSTVAGMVEGLDDRIYAVYNRFTSAISTNLVIAVNVDGMDKESAIARLMNTAWVSRGFAEVRYTFWTHPLWSTSFPHYWYGRELMRESYARMKDHLPDFYRMVYTEPHSVATFSQSIAEFIETQE
jgi:hypothetical protein